MPLAIALLIRSIIQLALTAAIYKTAEEFIRVALDALPKLLSKAFGINEQDSNNFIHDFMLDQAAAFGLTVLALRRKMPTIVAEKLGFTAKGFSKFGFTKQARTAIEGKIGGKIPIDLAKGTGYWKILGKFMGGVTAIFMLTQSIEVFAYRPGFFANIAKFFGLEKPVLALLIGEKKGIFSDKEITEITQGIIKIYGPGIEDFDLKQSVLINENYIKTLLELAENEIWAQAKTPTQSNVLKALREIVLPRITGKITPAAAGTSIAASKISAPQIKVFTGVLTQGKLGEAEPFIERETDLISSMDDLQSAAQNNLASFIIALPGKIVYEIKIVSSITTKEGFIQRGITQRIITGYTKAGAPKYKTIVNKFAVLDIFVFTERNIRTKIRRIVLGPVDSIAFQPKTNELQMAEETIKANITTSDVAEIETIKTDKEIITEPATPPILPGLTSEEFIKVFKISAPYHFFADVDKKILSGAGPYLFEKEYRDAARDLAQKRDIIKGRGYDPQLVDPYKARENTLLGLNVLAPEYRGFPGEEIKLQPKEPILAEYQFARPKVTLPAVAIPASNNPNRCLTATIAEYFDINKRSYPNVQERSKLYEAFDLGPANWYTGTGEQNMKLLKELKIRSGC